VTRYRLSPEAQADLTEIKRHLVGAGGARLARRVLGEIRRKVQFLADNPGAACILI
jgi:plasmid stabilization system protein ParE